VHALPAQRQGDQGRLSALRRHDLDPDPVRQFQAWFREAAAGPDGSPEPVALATADAAGRPAARMVLLRGVAEGDLRFYTGYTSRKADELAANPAAALLWHWTPHGRQVRVEGRVERLPEPESDAYFASRPRESRLGAWASEQSAVLPDRATLEAAFGEAGQRFPGELVPRPGRWGGYRLRPGRWEFWQHGDHRLHDRFRYAPDGAGGWRIDRLAP
jgi:pyridoxamine 5'-phosphate oxidase